MASDLKADGCLVDDAGPGIVRGIISMGVSSLVSMAFGFAGMTVAARHVPEEEFGVYFLLLAIVCLFGVVGSAGLRLGAAKSVASADSDLGRQAVVGNLLTLRLVTVLMVSLLAIGAKPILLFFYPSELLSSLFAYAPALFSLQLIEETLYHIMEGLQLYQKMAFVRVLAGVLNFAFVCVSLLVLKLGAEGLVVATIASLSVISLVCFFMIPTRRTLAFDPGLMRRILRFGLPLQGNDVLSFAFERIDVLILGALVGPTQIAYLEMAAKLPTSFRRLFASLQSVYFPHMSKLFAQDQRTEATRVMHGFLRLASFATMLCALACTLFAREIMVLLFSDRYLPGARALGLLMVVASIGVASTILDQALISAGFPAYLLIINLVTAALGVLGSASMIPLFGFMGAVYAKLVANAVANPVSVWCLRRERLGVRVREYLKPALLLGTCLGIYFVFDCQGILSRLLLIALFVVLAVALSVVTRDDVLTLVGSLRPLIRRSALDR